MAVVYSIKDWDENFEVAQSRKLDGPHAWVALPTKHDGKSFRRIMLLDDGPAIYGAWVLIVQIAAKCPTRGILADDDGPLDVTDLSIKTGAPQTLFTKALIVLSSRQIGWLMVDEWESSRSSLPTQDKTRQDIQDSSCGDDATGTANANGSENGDPARATENDPPQGAGDRADRATSKANGECYPESFEAFWEAYPTRGGRKRGKCKCLGIWRQAIRMAERQSLVEAARNYAASDDSTRGFAKDPERFLAKEWWRDWIPAIVAQQRAPPPVATPVPARIKPANFT